MRIILSSIFLSVLLGTATATSEDHPGQEEQASSNLRALSDVTTKIVGGKPSDPGEFPYYGEFISSTSSARRFCQTEYVLIFEIDRSSFYSRLEWMRWLSNRPRCRFDCRSLW